MNLLIIDFNETATDKVSLSRIVLGDRYNLLKGSRNDPSGLFILIASHHSMSLTAPGLSVGEDSSIVSLDHVVDE